MHIRLPLAVPLAFIAFFVLSSFPTAQAEVYKWKDAQGRTIISDTPQPGKKGAAVPSATIDPSDSSSVKALDDQDMEFKKRQEEREAAEKKQNEEAAAAAKKAENCDRSRRNLEMLESGARISQQNEKGEREFINDQQRQNEIDRIRRNMQENCS
ncbi:MAG: DUF4124 domain-containing protein [Zoogloeaceae bacterium]|jgi:hypothetical protein|nr:DUF4124 domain-containing protein [Zoogloeaceae bacterium]